MDVFLYLPPNLGPARDEIEDARRASLGEVARVTGGGSGERGSHVDLFVDDQVSDEKLLELLRECRRRLDVEDTGIVIAGREFGC